MADIELVIKIDENTYKMFKNLNQIIGIISFEKDMLALIKAVKNGTPLPKGHGRLIDASELNVALLMRELYGNKTAIQVIDEAQTIIEADRKEQE